MKLPRDVSGADAIKALERLGFSTIRQSTDHRSDASSLAIGMLQSIIRQAGVSVDEFLSAL